MDDEFEQNRCCQQQNRSSLGGQDMNEEEIKLSQLTELNRQVRTESQLVDGGVAAENQFEAPPSSSDQRGGTHLTTSLNQDGVVSVSVTAQVSEAHTKSMSEQKHSPLNINGAIIVANQQTPSNINPLSVVKSPVSDGFNWRKYGQKQVKSPQGSRSYYKCTHSDCFAKKIECSDLTGNVVEIVNKGLHSHEPPSNYNNSSRDKSVSSTSAVFTEQPIKMLTNHDSPVQSKELAKETSIVVSERKRPSSDGNSEMQGKEKHSSEPEPKRRMKKCNSESSSDLSKPGKKPKFVVHAAGDVGISGDGYRWRKYGQKMVKGNPHPRNYYRCTSAGCPVRKHIEADVDNTSAVIITYKGIHDHDMPVPKKRHGPPSAPLLTAAARASKNNNNNNNVQQNKIDSNQNQKTQWSVDKEGELTGDSTSELGSEKKVFESARTLLSIGFEIKPC